MSVWSILFPSSEMKRQRLREEAELIRLGEDRHNTLRTVQLTSRSGSRLMETYAGAMQMMARGDNEDL